MARLDHQLMSGLEATVATRQVKSSSLNTEGHMCSKAAGAALYKALKRCNLGRDEFHAVLESDSSVTPLPERKHFTSAIVSESDRRFVPLVLKMSSTSNVMTMMAVCYLCP